MTPRNVIEKVHGGTGADRSGLKAGDVIIAIDGHRLSRGVQFLSLLPKGNSGSVVTLVVVRLILPEPDTESAGPCGRGRRKRVQPERLSGNATLDCIRLGNGARSHVQRLAGMFAGQTGDSL